MKQLELKHIAPYLPYELKCNKKWTLTSLSNYEDDAIFDYSAKFNGFNKKGYIQYLKPLLRPMSDLFETIVHNGEIVCVAKVIAERDDDLYFDEENNAIYDDQVGFDLVFNGETFPNIIAYWIVEILFKYHFDVFGLIEKGLAEPIKNK